MTPRDLVPTPAYQPPLERLSRAQMAALSMQNRRLKSFQKLESQAALLEPAPADVPPLARLSLWQWASLRLRNRHLKRFQKLEAQAAEMLGELTAQALGEVASDLVHRALDLIGHDPDEEGIEVLPTLDAGFGVVYVEVYTEERKRLDEKPDVTLGCCVVPGVDIVVPRDSAAWDEIVDQLVGILRTAIAEVRAGAPVIDIATRRRVS